MFSFFRADDGTNEILFEEISDKSNIWTRIDFPLDIKDKNYQVVMSGQYTRMETMPFGKFSLSEKNGILLPKLFWPTVRKNCSTFEFEAEGREFSKFLRSLEQFIQTVKGQNNSW